MEADAICARCGDPKAGFAQVCSACGHRPEGDGMLVAWLLSRAHLDEVALQASAARIQSGEPIRPSAKMLKVARRALGRQFSTDVGLPARELGGILLGNVLFSPLVGVVCAVWWWNDRPRAAVQAALVTVPVSVVGTGLFVWGMGVS